MEINEIKKILKPNFIGDGIIKGLQERHGFTKEDWEAIANRLSNGCGIYNAASLQSRLPKK